MHRDPRQLLLADQNSGRVLAHTAFSILSTMADSSASRRAGIVAVTVAFTDAAVLPVDEEFCALIAADAAAFADGFPLRVAHVGSAFRATALDGPAVLVRDDVMRFAHGLSPL